MCWLLLSVESGQRWCRTRYLVVINSTKCDTKRLERVALPQDRRSSGSLGYCRSERKRPEERIRSSRT